MRIPIFKPDSLDYKDEGYSKPIKYTEQFLRKIAEDTKEVLLDIEHSGKVIGSLTDFTYEDGTLQCVVSDGVDVTGKGVSPKFEFELIEHEDCFEAVNGVLINAGLTNNPRSHIVCNSIKQDENMTDEALKQAMKQNAKLERELALKDNELGEMQKKLEAISELEEQIAELKEANAKYASNYDDLKNKAKAYDENVAKQKAELIDKIADGDEDMAKRLENHSLQQLTDVFDVYKKHTNPKGISTTDPVPNTPQGNGGDDGEGKYSDEDFASLYEQFFGDKPTYSF